MSRAILTLRSQGDRSRAHMWIEKAPKNTRVPRPIRIDGDKAYVPLTKGYEAVVDTSDIHLIEGRNWSALSSPRRNAVYAVRVEASNGRQKMILMHRILLAAPDGMLVDHIDRDGLNNRRGNLRLCTLAQNVLNKGLRSDNKSGFTGVFFEARAGKWRAAIQVSGKSCHLGYFDDPDLAHAAYCSAAEDIHGDFRRKQ